MVSLVIGASVIIATMGGAFVYLVVIPSLSGNVGPCNGHSAMGPFALGGPNGGYGATTARAGSLFLYNFTFLHCIPAHLVPTNIMIRSLSSNGAPVQGVVSYSLANLTDGPFAVENASSLRWVSGAEVPIASQGYLSVASNANLTLDNVEVDWSPQGGAMFSGPYCTGNPPLCGT